MQIVDSGGCEEIGWGGGNLFPVAHVRFHRLFLLVFHETHPPSRVPIDP